MASLAISIASNVARAALQTVAARAISAAFADDVEGPRLDDVRLQTSSEGAGLPIVFGRARLAGQVIWATRYVETATTTSSGGKGGGPSVTEYTYAANFAVAVCEGPIDGFGRVWANGAPFDLSGVTVRFYTGEESQVADPLMEAIEGVGDPPAFRGAAYVVFENLPLEAFGNRIPQLNFEVFRAPAATPGEPRLEDLAQGVTLIPGSGEFAYATSSVLKELAPGAERAVNLNNARGFTDITAALDDLQARLPKVQSVMVVVAWFGSDLRCGDCLIRPGAEDQETVTRPYAWSVSGQTRDAAYLVSRVDGRPTYGGTPSDQSVFEAVAELKARGLSVGLYPFILMDIPAGNGLPDPYGGAEQAAHPWRGRITCHPAPGQPGTPDKTAAAADQVAAFFGVCQPTDFSSDGQTVAYSGPDEWSLRRLILHYAHLAAAAGGVDAFLIGSELRGLTQVRDSASSYPTVSALRTLAADVRSVVRAETKISYAADWSEYFGHQPADGSRDVFFHLDPFWADGAVDFIGLDWYAPLADWRDGLSHVDAQTWRSGHDRTYLAANVEGGEGYAWFYADDADRAAQTRTPITDGGAGKAWVFRYKDLRNWWSNAHYDRPGGSETGAPTAWVPQSKPFWFVEAGCPAVDKGANQPNVFFDPKSAESALPHFSSGARDDLIQRRAIEALLDYWDEAGDRNPVSAVYGGPMLDMSRAHLWTWDTRPFPDFPARRETWSDGANWRLGHWLTGRAGLAPLANAVEELASRSGVAPVDVSELDGVLTGYVVDRPMSARAALEPLASIFRFEPAERSGSAAFVQLAPANETVVSVDDLAIDADGRRIERTRAPVEERPLQARLRFIDDTRDYRAGAASARGDDAARRPVVTVSAPVTLDHAAAEAIARAWLTDAAALGEQVAVNLSPAALAIEPGDGIVLRRGMVDERLRVVRLVEGLAREAVLTRVSEAAVTAFAGAAPGTVDDPVAPPARPAGAVLDVPLLEFGVERNGPLVGAAADPWPGEISVQVGEAERARLTRPHGMGELLWALYPGPIGRWDDGNRVRVRMHHGTLASADAEAVLGGANAMAVESAAGGWEIVQFRSAALVGAGEYELSGFLRGQAGSDPEMGAPTPVGARIVMLDSGLAPARFADHELGETVAWRFAAVGLSAQDPAATVMSQIAASRHLRPLSPGHLRVARTEDGVRFTWTRRTRVGGDDWSAPDAPLGETEERYTVTLYRDGEAVSAREVAAPELILTAAEELALFPDAPRYAFELSVAQHSERFGLGAERRAVAYV